MEDAHEETKSNPLQSISPYDNSTIVLHSVLLPATIMTTCMFWCNKEKTLISVPRKTHYAHCIVEDLKMSAGIASLQKSMVGWRICDAGWAYFKN